MNDWRASVSSALKRHFQAAANDLLQREDRHESVLIEDDVWFGLARRVSAVTRREGSRATCSFFTGKNQLLLHEAMRLDGEGLDMSHRIAESLSLLDWGGKERRVLECLEFITRKLELDGARRLLMEGSLLDEDY